jgi:hypothetical protein
VNDSDAHKWSAVVFFLACSLFFVGCVWYLWAGAMNPDYYWQPAEALALESPEPSVKRNERVVLTKNNGAQVGNARIVYRGSQGGYLLLDLYILQLDPHYGYPHHIDTKQAREGFRMGGCYFKLLAASDAKISLKRL